MWKKALIYRCRKYGRRYYRRDSAGWDFSPQQVWASAPSMTHLSLLQRDYQIHITEDNQEVAAQSDILVLAVKPSFDHGHYRADQESD